MPAMALNVSGPVPKGLLMILVGALAGPVKKASELICTLPQESVVPPL